MAEYPWKTIEERKLVMAELHDLQLGMCIGCRKAFNLEEMTLDHIVPRSKGGGNEFGNLQLLCGQCNSLKGQITIDDLDALTRAVYGRGRPKMNWT